MSFFDKMKQAGKTMVDSGAKAMLKTDIVLLEREIKNRKQRFGVEVYELMEQLEVDNETSIDEKETKIRLAFDNARKDIAVIQAKIECKKEEISEVERSMNVASSSTSISANHQMGSSFTMSASHPGDATEMEHGMQS